jgi:hypothetical protein
MKPDLHGKLLPLDSHHFEMGIKLRDLKLHDLFKDLDHAAWSSHEIVFATNDRGVFKSEAVLRGYSTGVEFVKAITGQDNIDRDNQRFRIYSFMGAVLRQAVEIPSYNDRLKIEQEQADRAVEEGRKAAGL